MPLPLVVLTWAFIGLTFFISVRMGRTGWAHRSVPEGLISLFFAGGGAGYSLLMLPHSFSLSEGTLSQVENLAGTLLALPAVAIVFFTWRVFRPADGWARALAWGLGILTAASTLAARWIAPAMGIEHPFSLEPGAPFFWITTGLRAFAFAWSCVEASVYFAKAQRRVRTGLMDPVTANRFLLWALWSGSAAAMVVLRTVFGLVRGTQGHTDQPPVAMVMMLLAAGLVCIAAMLLTFQPPVFYTRFVEQRAAAAAA